MPPHKLLGTWHSYVVVKLPGAPPQKSIIVEDDDIVIDSVDETTLQIGGSHNGKTITGTFIPTGSSFAVVFEHDFSVLKKHHYEGSLVAEDSVHNVLIISGTKRPVPKTLKSKKKASVKSAAVTTGQEDGTWVATKP
jgi:hypothetical protein